MVRHALDDDTLVGRRVGHVEVVRLGAGGRDVRSELVLHRCLAAGDRVLVIADADDLGGTVDERVVGRNDRGLKLDRPRFVLGVGSLGVRDIPVGASVHPDVQTVSTHHVDDRRRDLGRYRAFIDNGHVRQDDDSAVEGGHRRRHAERLHQHPHAAWRASARDGEHDSSCMEVLHRPDGTRCQHLVLGHEGAVNVGQHAGDRRCHGCRSLIHLGPSTGVVVVVDHDRRVHNRAQPWR